MKKRKKYFLSICFLIFLITVTSCSVRETTPVSRQQIPRQEEQPLSESNPQNRETENNGSKEIKSDSAAGKEQSDLSDKNLSDAEYEISFEEIPFSEDFPDLAFTPTLFEDKILLTFALPLSDTPYKQCNTMLYDLKTKTAAALPFYAPNRFYANETDYYYLSNRYSGEGITTVMRMNRETLEPETIYSSPEGYQLTCNLSFGNGFLVWAQAPFEGEYRGKFELWGYDIVKEEIFLIDSHCRGDIDYPYEINNGFLCYPGEQSLSKSPYLLVGYSLKDRKQVASVATEGEPMSFVFNGTHFAWSEQLDKELLHFSKKDSDEIHTVAEEAACPVFIKDLCLFYTSGVPKNKIELYDLEKEEKNLISSNIKLKERESFLTFCSTDDPGRAVFMARTKSADPGENNARLFLLTVTEKGR